MSILQRAINYETAVYALRKSDSFLMPIFEHAKTWCDADAPLIDNINVYSFLLDADEKALSDAYTAVSQAFERLPEDVVILGKEDGFWPQDVVDYPFLYLKGKKELLQKKGLSIVGTRMPSDRGIELTKQAVDAVGKEYTIVSGLAKGIDGAAHIQALGMGFDTIAVIGTPIDEYYPKEHRQLQDLIAEYGLVVSPFAPSRQTQQYFFISRNNVMSEIASGSLIVESSDTGGGVKQAYCSEKQEKPVFIFRETYENKELTWPKEFEDPVVIDDPLQIKRYLNGEVPIPKKQKSLFD